MLNKLRPLLALVLTPIAQVLARTPLTPNMVTVIGTLGVAASALALYPGGHLFWGSLICAIFVLLDMLDGTLARIKGTTGKFGAFLDSAMDRVADAAIFAGLAAYYVVTQRGPGCRWMAGLAIFCLVSGALVSYARARAEGLGIPCDVGIAERPERMLTVLTAAGLYGLGVPYILPIGLWALAAASAITFGQRVYVVYRTAAAIPADPPAPADPAGARAPESPEGRL